MADRLKEEMPEQAKPLTFTLSDHDALVATASVVKQILEKFTMLEGRLGSIEARVKNVEDWKIRVMAIVLCMGIFLGYALRIVDFFGKFVSSPSAQSLTIQSTPPAPVTISPPLQASPSKVK